MSEWHIPLRRAYEQRRAGDRAVTQAVIARRVGIGRRQLVQYLHGKLSRPDRDVIIGIGRELDVGAGALNGVLLALGYDPVPDADLARLLRRHVPLASAAEATAAYPWPALVVNDTLDIVAWNRAAVKLSSVDFGRDLPTLRDRNLLRLAADPRFKDQLENWGEVIAYLMSMHKNAVSDLFSADGSTPYLATVIQDISRLHPENLGALIAVWSGAEPRREEQRNLYHPRWQPAAGGPLLSFNVVGTGWSDFEATFANDWMPADAATWDWFHDTAATGWTPPDPVRQAPLEASLGERLREVRERYRLTQAELSGRSGVSVQDIARYEHGRRTPTRARLLHIARALLLDGSSTNVLLAAAGYAPEPSEWARFLAGLTPLAPVSRWRTAPLPLVPLEHLAAQIAAHPWPCMVVDQRCTIAGWNAAAERVFGLESGPPPENLIGFIMRADIRARFVNWPEVVTNIAPSPLREKIALPPERYPAALQRLVADLGRIDPELLPDLRELWRTAPPAVLAQRVVFEAYWQHPDGTVLAFNTLLALGPSQGHWLLDWHPADAETWRWLGRP